MTDYTELIKALRCCKIHIPCKECPKYKSTGSLCVSDLHDDAAAAIEALQAQLPKRGEWKITTEKFTPELICSKCGVHIPCVAGWCMDAHMNYCPNCGAKMEVQDGK